MPARKALSRRRTKLKKASRNLPFMDIRWYRRKNDSFFAAEVGEKAKNVGKKFIFKVFLQKPASHTLFQNFYHFPAFLPINHNRGE